MYVRVAADLDLLKPKESNENQSWTSFPTQDTGRIFIVVIKSELLFQEK